MASDSGMATGKICAIWRYPVKSMLGEKLDSVEVTNRGLAGDRAYALVHAETGKVASAKNPHRWPNLFEFQASYAQSPSAAQEMSPAEIVCPTGERVSTKQADAEARLSAAVGQKIQLRHSGFPGAVSEGYWPAYDWLAAPNSVFEFRLPAYTFFDGAMVHLLTTSTLARLQALAPDSQFDVRRFRPNLVIQPSLPSEGFVENDWIGRILTIGAVELLIEEPCPRCVMTTLPQGDLPKDPNVLRTIVRANGGNAGVYATVRSGGIIRCEDIIRVD
jgi:uncharacterized protein YcbX